MESVRTFNLKNKNVPSGNAKLTVKQDSDKTTFTVEINNKDYRYGYDILNGVSGAFHRTIMKFKPVSHTFKADRDRGTIQKVRVGITAHTKGQYNWESISIDSFIKEFTKQFQNMDIQKEDIWA